MTTATKVNGMSKPKRNKVHREFGLPDDAIVSHIAVPKRYVPPEHQGCMQLRANKTDRFGVVRSTQTLNTPTETIVTRYCQCKFCGASYQDVTINKR